MDFSPLSGEATSGKKQCRALEILKKILICPVLIYIAELKGACNKN